MKRTGWARNDQPYRDTREVPLQQLSPQERSDSEPLRRGTDPQWTANISRYWPPVPTADVPTELVSVTDTEPIALESPECVKGARSENKLP